MLTKKKQAVLGLHATSVALIAILTGCSPSGPEMLLDGKDQLDRGQPARAVRKLREASQLMPTNALAWGYLGLAYQQVGATTNAVAAYARALSLSPNTAEIRYNLGCVWMSQGEWEQAREQFAATTLLQKNFAPAWQRLGESQLRLGNPDEAVVCLGESLKLNPDNPDTWNWLGVAQQRKGRAEEARRCFESALNLRANHGPALLNLAVLHQTALKQPDRAFDLYQQYLAFFPNAVQAAQVRRLARDLDPGNQPQPVVPVALTTPEEEGGAAVSKPSTAVVQAAVRTNRVVLRERATAPPRSPVPTEVPEPELRETVEVKPAPAVAKAASAPAPAASPTASQRQKPGTSPTTSSPAVGDPDQRPVEDDTAQKRGFFSKINPLNLLKKKQRDPKTTPLPERGDSRAGVAPQAGGGIAAQETPIRVDDSGQFPRYRYATSAPVAGDRRAATSALKRGEKLDKRGKEAEALQAYMEAVQADPTFFLAQFRLGSQSLVLGDPARALAAFETATRIEPESSAARYNFAMTLRTTGYPVDSAKELLELLKDDPEDVRAHLALGNLYAQTFGDKAQARREYRQVLALSPGHPQASAIHLWLVRNPL
jgi:Flp pilus assembly protein TadD